MIRRLLSAVAFLLLASTAQAAPINLLLTFDFAAPAIGKPEMVSYVYRVFESPANVWPNTFLAPQTVLALGSGSALPGVREVELSVNVENPDNLYLDIWGEWGFGGANTYGRYYAVPPGAEVSGIIDGRVNGFGPQWIPLADLGDGLSGDLRWFFGFSRGPIGTWALAPAPDDLPENPSPVPEPASMLLLGSGLAAVAAKKYRQSKAR